MSTLISIIVILWLVAIVALVVTFYSILKRKLDELDSKVSTIRSDCETTLRHCESIADRQVDYYNSIIAQLRIIRSSIDNVPTFLDEYGHQIDSITFSQAKSDRKVTIIGAGDPTTKDSESTSK